MSEEQPKKEEEGSSFCGKCWDNDRLNTLGWAAVFIWGGLVLLAGTTNFSSRFAWWDGGKVFFAGAGVIVLLQTIIRLLVPQYRESWVGSLVFACILLSIGLGDILVWIWPLVLVVIGVVILRSAFTRKR